VKNDYSVGLTEDGHGLDCEIETYLKIDVSRIYA
jgi:hypothetical protein